MDTPERVKMPPQIPFIIGNEACERFSFYGMRNILAKFLPSSLILAYLPASEREGMASEVFHTFVMGVYFFPLLGGWLADRFFGKYNTILWFSLIYCAGHGCLALFEDNRDGFYTGLFLIALGAGGIKPLVSSFVGDQFDQRTKHLAKRVYDAFYWSINFGSFFASLLMPIFLRNYGPSVAFGIPGVLMLVATIVFWAGRGRYIRIAPAPPNPSSFLRVSATAVMANGVGMALAIAGVVLALGSFVLLLWLEVAPVICIALVSFLVLGGIAVSTNLEHARGKHPDVAIDGVRAVLRILIVFSLVTPFWSLFDQKASLWVFQGNHMIQPGWFESSQMQVVNPALVMILLPFTSLVLFPWLDRRRGKPISALAKMSAGIALAGCAFIAVAILQLQMDGGDQLWIFWQIIPYILLTTGEILVSATGLEFAYSQAPLAMKGVIMSFWNLAVTVGNLWVLLANATVKNKAVTEQIESTGLSERAFLMFFFAAFAFLAALAFRAYAKRYKMVDNYVDRSPAPVAPSVPKATARAK